VFAASFMLFTGLLVAIGAAVPTAKEAGGFFGIVMMLIFGPLYALPLFISNPESPFVQALSTIPLTAPIPLLLRNAVGNLTVPEAALSVALLIVTGVVIMVIAVRVFKYGALEYSRKLSLKEIFSRN
jgi:ABC-2 type transport system permease protein